MAIRKVKPCLVFNGTAAKALGFYEQVLGGRAETVMVRDRVLRAKLRIGGEVILASDSLPGLPVEGNVPISLDFDDAAEMGTTFDALAAGGQVTHPLHDTFWGERLGTLTDAFGVHWVLSCDL